MISLNAIERPKKDIDSFQVRCLYQNGKSGQNNKNLGTFICIIPSMIYCLHFWKMDGMDLWIYTPCAPIVALNVLKPFSSILDINSWIESSLVPEINSLSNKIRSYFKKSKPLGIRVKAHPPPPAPVSLLCK